MKEVSLAPGRVSVVACFFASLVVTSPALADVLTLMWDANVDPVAGYVVYIGQDTNSLSQRVDVGNVTTFSLTDAISGRQYCFAVSAYVDATSEGPKSGAVCGFSNAYPTLENPGDQSGAVGSPVSLQLVGSDTDGQAVTYDATGLPPGVTIMKSTGLIAGAGTSAGTYTVTASVSDGVLSTSVTFTWKVAPPDTKAPSVVIVSPTKAPKYTSATASVALAGTSADNIGVASVEWTNDRGGSGVAVGTTSWNIPSISLLGGVNNITVTARDAAGNLGIDILAVTYVASDTVPPAISITTPTTSSSYSTTGSSLSLGGIASDDTMVTAVTWANDHGESGVATGTASWTISAVPLQLGTNVIVVAAQDAAGNRGSDTITVEYATPLPPSALILQGDVIGSGKWAKVELTWTLVSGRWAEVFRDGNGVARTRNDGYYSETTQDTGAHTYRVCIVDTDMCSNVIRLSY